MKSNVLPVFDTWAKFQSSALRGNLVIPGGFIDCTNFRHESNLTTVGTFQGQHCMVDFSAVQEVADIDRNGDFDWREMWAKFVVTGNLVLKVFGCSGEIARANNLNFRHGFCLPASCSSQKVLSYVNRYLARAGFIGSTTRCQNNDQVRYEPLDIFAMWVLRIKGPVISDSNLSLFQRSFLDFGIFASGLYNLWSCHDKKWP